MAAINGIIREPRATTGAANGWCGVGWFTGPVHNGWLVPLYPPYGPRKELWGTGVTILPPYASFPSVPLLVPYVHRVADPPGEANETKGSEWHRRGEWSGERKGTRTGTNQGSVCKVGTQDPENLDEELKPLVTVWSVSLFPFHSTLISQPKAWRSERRDRRHGGGCDGNGNRTDGPTIRLWILELGTRDHIVVTVRLSFALSGSSVPLSPSITHYSTPSVPLRSTFHLSSFASLTATEE